MSAQGTGLETGQVGRCSKSSGWPRRGAGGEGPGSQSRAELGGRGRALEEESGKCWKRPECCVKTRMARSSHKCTDLKRSKLGIYLHAAAQVIADHGSVGSTATPWGATEASRSGGSLSLWAEWSLKAGRSL